MFILLEGLDRSGKSTVAEFYKKQGYDVVHMSAPSKKYIQPGYAGPSYLDDCVALYMKYNGKNVIFDRTVYGETLWPHVYSRDPQLSEDDLEILREIEDSNDAQRIYMYDTDREAHWRRCVDNNEPLNRGQFVLAYKLYDKLVKDHGFQRKTLKDFDVAIVEQPKLPKPAEVNKEAVPVSSNPVSTESSVVTNYLNAAEKLEQANAINDLLGGRIIKKRSEIYDTLEGEIRTFLTTKLNKLLGNPVNDLTDEELFVLKSMAKRLLEKGDKK